MILTAAPEDGAQVKDITARAGVFHPQEVTSLSQIWDEYRAYGAENSGYYFIVEKEEGRVLGYACYGPRDYDLAPGVFDLYWIAVAPEARRSGAGRGLIAASEESVRSMGARMIVVETSGAPHYEPTRKFYYGVGYALEASIKDFYASGDDLNIFIKRF